ncbi:uncharacterized protein LOC111065762 [Drosophila obscura]|uniref:uncharacterized protein LOC111065762 n=1 Tax=Drosophila obscura TaxID=7282 RepID=UPI000BA0A9E6|nr:uncharacterized protein LOC111065762 [Drosophila obscura]
MKLAIILIGSLVLLLVPGVPVEGSYGKLRLAYNPTYDIWFFQPKGKPKNVSKKVQEAYYAAKKKGGVCFANNIWSYCITGEIIEETKP